MCIPWLSSSLKRVLCLDPNTNTVYTTYCALFDENVFPFAQKSDLTNPHIPFSNSVIDSAWFPSKPTNTDSTSSSSSSQK